MSIGPISAVKTTDFIPTLGSLSEIRRQTPLGMAATGDTLSENADLFFDVPPPKKPKLYDYAELAYRHHQKIQEFESYKQQTGMKIASAASNEITEDLNRRVGEQSTVTFWGHLADITKVLTSSASLIIGTGLVASGAPFGVIAGGSLIIGGGLNVAALSLGYIGMDEKTIGALSFVAMGFSFIGSLLSWGSLDAQTTTLIPSIIQTSLTVLQGVSTIGDALSKSTLALIDKRITKQREIASQMDRRGEGAVEAIQQSVTRMRQSIASLVSALLTLENEKRTLLSVR